MSDYKECLNQGAPLMTLPQDGQAPVLNYNIPQKTVFSVYGSQRLPIPKNFFKSNGLATEDWNEKWQELAKSEDDRLVKMIRKDVESGLSMSGLIIDLSKLENNKLLKSAGGKAIPSPEFDGDGNDYEKPQKVILDAEGEANVTITKEIGIDAEIIVQKIKEGYVPVVVDKFDRSKKELRFIKRPEPGKTYPMLFIMHEFKVASYLGDYGAGKTLRTFSLLPGEKTTITIKSFFESKETKKKSENVMDSFSESSANSFEDTLREESSKTSSRESSTENSTHEAATNDVNTSLSANGLIYGVNVSASVSASFHEETSIDTVTSTSSALETSVNNTHEALEKHTNETNASREVQITSESESSVTTSEEKSTVRELINPNLNRVLNFVFRQLLQEYITITYLNNIKVIFVNGHPENTIVVPINELDFLLRKVIKDKYVEAVKELIYSEFEYITNYKGDEIKFLNKKTVKQKFIKPTGNKDDYIIDERTIEYLTKKPGLEDSYTSGGLEIKVPGVIMKVSKHTLRTSSVIVDALLGRGDALDCFNQLQQEAKSIKLELENAKLQNESDKIKWDKERLDRILNIIENLPDELKADTLKKVFSTCCDEELDIYPGEPVKK